METLHDNNAALPDRLNEDWRFGQPHIHARELQHLLESAPGDAGDLCIETADGIGGISIGEANGEQELPSIGSGYLVRQIQAKSVQRMGLTLTGDSSAEHPVTLSCKATGLFLPYIDITIESGVHAHVVERHVHRGDSTLICQRRYTIKPGASLHLELREEGSGSSRSLNITHLRCAGELHHISSHCDHTWAREETTAELTERDAELLLLSANRLTNRQILDQRTLQRHCTPGAKSRLLYKNVVDDRATAIFGGNIRVETGAHDTDAYLSNLNMMLSEHATVHSLPGLEILADRVRCSHGSATAPMDPEQLFYLLSRGIDEAAARTLLAEGFLADVWERFRA